MNRKTAAKILHTAMSEDGVLDCFDVDSVLYNKIDPELYEAAKTLNYSIAANGTLYKNEKTSFLAQLMEDLFNERKEVKKKMLVLEQQKEEALNLLKTKYNHVP